MCNIVCYVGINDYDGKISIRGKHIKSYDIWRHMLMRCYDIKDKSYNRYGMAGVTVCKEWLLFSKFKEWFDANYPYHLEKQGIRLHLDKDLLSNDKRVYSPDTCVFIPSMVNSFMTNKKNNNTSGYTGVSWDSVAKKWIVKISEFDNNKYKHIGRFTNIEDARKAYIKAREVQCIKVKGYLKELGYDEEIINKIR